MGMFDIVIINCHNCQKETSAQTKLSHPLSLETLTIGSDFSQNLTDTILLLKESCVHCQSNNAIILSHGIIKAVTHPDNALVEEKSGGTLATLKEKHE